MLSSPAPPARLTCGRLLVVDQEDATFRSVERIVSRHRPVRHVHTFEAAMVALKARSPWCGFLFDLTLGARDEGGLELLEMVHRDFPGVPSALVTGRIDASIVNRVATLGATVFFRPLGEPELLPFLQRVMAREHGFGRDFSERLGAISRGYKLSPREHEVLTWFVSGHSRDGYLAFTGLAETTFKTHVKHLLAKMHAATLPDAVSIALRQVVIKRMRGGEMPTLRKTRAG